MATDPSKTPFTGCSTERHSKTWPTRHGVVRHEVVVPRKYVEPGKLAIKAQRKGAPVE